MTKMTRKLARAIKKQIKKAGLDEKQWKCEFLLKEGHAYYFKVGHNGDAGHDMIWSCYLAGDHFVFDISPPID